ncbi:hypothetical protein RB595_005934 [Gaeumannomyces hyphopodioides]
MDPASNADVDVTRPAPGGNADATPQWRPPRMDDLFDHSPIPALVLSPTYRVVRASGSLLRSWGPAATTAAPPDVGGAEVFDLLARHESGWDAPQTALLIRTLESAVLKRSCCEMRAVLSRSGGGGGAQGLALRVVPVFRDDELLSFVLEWQPDCKDTTSAEPPVHNWGTYEFLKRRCPNTVVLVLNRDGIVTRSSTTTTTKLGCDSTEVLGQHWTALTGLNEDEVASHNWISRRDDPKWGFWAEVQELLMTQTGSDTSEQHERVLVIRDLTEELVLERSLQVTRREAASLLSDQDSVDDPALAKLAIDAAGIVRKIVKEEGKVASQRINAEFRHDIPPRLLGDPVEFAQMVRALVSNAVEFSGEGEDISVRLDPVFCDEESVALGLVVTDQGFGVDKDVEEALLWASTPCQRHTAGDKPTRGLSLHLADKAARGMGGFIRPDPNDAAGKGTVFRAHVKLARFPADPPWVPPPGHLGRAPLPLIRWLTGDQREHIEAISPRTRILLVEDNRITIKIFEKIVCKYGFTDVDMATSGQEGVDMFLANPLNYDIIFMDRTLPDMDGLEAARKIRSAGFLNVPIVDVNPRALGDYPSQDEAIPRVWLGKPLRTQDLIRTILDCVPKEKKTWPVLVYSRI